AYFRAHPDAEVPRHDDPVAAAAALAESRTPVSHRHATGQTHAFAIGERVRAKNIHPRGHTRLPRYVRGKWCTVVQHYGVQEFSDGWPNEQFPPQPLYNVRFEGQELWGDAAEPNSAVY